MKKLNLFLSALTVASVLSFAGCTGNSSNPTSSTSTITTSEEKHTVTLVKNNGFSDEF